MFAYGITLSELVLRAQPYAELSAVAAATAVVRDNLRPRLPATLHAPLAALMAECWSADVAARPSAVACATRLRQMLVEQTRANLKAAQPQLNAQGIDEHRLNFPTSFAAYIDMDEAFE